MLKDKIFNDVYRYIKENRKDFKIDLSQDFQLEFLAQGEYNINFTIKDKANKYVFRINTKSQLEIENQIRYEYNALKALEKSSVTPKVYFVDDSKLKLDYGILIMEFLEGRPLQYKYDLEKAAHIFSKIHTLKIDETMRENFIIEKNLFAERIKEAQRLLNEFFTSSLIDDKLKQFFNEFLDWAEKNSHKEKYFKDNKLHVINNTEVNSNNFIIGVDKSYLIDWEKPVISDPCQDITQFLAITTTLWKADYILSEEEKNNFFEFYIERTGYKDIKDRVYLYQPYLYLRALSWCAYAYLEYLKPDKEIKNEDTFKKIKSYLDIDFMKKILKENIDFENI
ncbi:Predicted kinase, aminoglycoside phosphotransferase (APT) family [Caloramator quimbayensis]|uniref:Predicted kinase, aminoglycoside phosphotransferase (APT) family n=1 Tax=Caloramator quimbayensis TaxID=1147123 RepID=A0A1T4X0C3_9CLOT|nr:phosphotransferase [Caloramator quimbayensis]SKA83004.1 Predicted kinase, aminoglycoside phosphotransferase (APT) family [Caloramator quimbayensis]